MKATLTIGLLFVFFRVFGSGGSKYYLDSRYGDDGNNGTAAGSAWKSFAPLERVRLRPGDSVLFRRGSIFHGRLVIADSGMPGRPLVLTAYGQSVDPAPMFMNTVFSDGTFGNCIRVAGSWVVVENLAFSGTAAYSPVEYAGTGWVVWEMGAIHLERGAEHCVVRNNEIRDCVAGYPQQWRLCVDRAQLYPRLQPGVEGMELGPVGHLDGRRSPGGLF